MCVHACMRARARVVRLCALVSKCARGKGERRGGGGETKKGLEGNAQGREGADLEGKWGKKCRGGRIGLGEKIGLVAGLLWEELGDIKNNSVGAKGAYGGMRRRLCVWGGNCCFHAPKLQSLAAAIAIRLAPHNRDIGPVGRAIAVGRVSRNGGHPPRPPSWRGGDH